MIKKVLIIGVLVFASLILVLGGINRTLAKTEGVSLLQVMIGNQANDEFRSDESKNLNLSSLNKDTDFSNWINEEGTVTSVNDLAIQIQFSDGRMIVLEDRAWEYALLSGFSIEKGDRIQLAGFFEGEEFEVAVMTNAATGQEVKLRDDTGRSMWSGRGNRNRN